ncbi:hypothetical protein YK56LOC_36710 [Caballeronia sp. HLA56]
MNKRVLIAVVADTQTSKGTEYGTVSYDAARCGHAFVFTGTFDGTCCAIHERFDAMLREAFEIPRAIQGPGDDLDHASWGCKGMPDGLAEREGAPRLRTPIEQIANLGSEWG